MRAARVHARQLVVRCKTPPSEKKRKLLERNRVNNRVWRAKQRESAKRKRSQLVPV
jgi:hypothetical protein